MNTARSTIMKKRRKTDKVNIDPNLMDTDVFTTEYRFLIKIQKKLIEYKYSFPYKSIRFVKLWNKYAEETKSFHSWSGTESAHPIGVRQIILLNHQTLSKDGKALLVYELWCDLLNRKTLLASVDKYVKIDHENNRPRFFKKNVRIWFALLFHVIPTTFEIKADNTPTQ